MNLDYQIAKDYLNKLPENLKSKLCNRTLGEVRFKKQSNKELQKFYSGYVKNQIKAGKL